jgi:AraC family transcriptional regulator
VWLVDELVDRAARLDDEVLDRGIEVSVDDGDDVASLRSLLSRLVGQMDMWNCAIANTAYDWSLEEHEEVSDMRRRLDQVGPTYLGHIREVCEQGRLDETFVDALCDPPEVFTYAGMLAHVLTFAAYRRTLAVQALDAAGIGDLGWGDPMRWVAEPA